MMILFYLKNLAGVFIDSSLKYDSMIEIIDNALQDKVK